MMDDRIAMRLVEAIEQIAKTSLKNDEILLDTINALTTEVKELERRIFQLESSLDERTQIR